MPERMTAILSTPAVYVTLRKHKRITSLQGQVAGSLVISGICLWSSPEAEKETSMGRGSNHVLGRGMAKEPGGVGPGEERAW